jgi:hypothetical protein
MKVFMKKKWVLRLLIFSVLITVTMLQFFIAEDMGWKFLSMGIFVSVIVPMTVIQNDFGKKNK